MPFNTEQVEEALVSNRRRQRVITHKLSLETITGESIHSEAHLEKMRAELAELMAEERRFERFLAYAESNESTAPAS